MIYQYSNMPPRLSGQTSIFGVVFFVSKSLLGIVRIKKLNKFTNLTRKPRSHVRLLIYRTWPIKSPFWYGIQVLSTIVYNMHRFLLTIFEKHIVLHNISEVNGRFVS